MKILLLLLISTAAYADTITLIQPSCFTGTSGATSPTCNGFRANDNTNSVLWFGDTWYGGSYTAAGNHFSSYNDGWLIANTNFANVGVVKLSPYGGPSGGANGTTLLNWLDSTMQAAYTNTNIVGPTNCNAAPANCTYKSRMFATVAGHTYWNIFLDGGTTSVSGATWLRSDDIDTLHPHWCNSATIAGLAPGDPCPNNATTLAGDLPNWTTNSGVMFPPPGTDQINTLGHWHMLLPANYQDDGIHCPVIPTSMGGDGAGTYTYFYTDIFSTHYGPYRMLCSDMPKLDATKMEAWTGSAWSSTLTSAHVIGTLCWCYPTSGTGFVYESLNPGGTSPSFYVSTTLGTIVMQATGYQYTPISFAGTQMASQSSTIFGPFTPLPNSGFPGIPQYQYNTNPKSRTLDANINSSVTTLVSDASNPYNSGWEPPFLPFGPMQIGSEKMIVTGATNNSSTWTVVRGAYGTSAASHTAGDDILTPFRMEQNLGHPIIGTESCSNGECTYDTITTGCESAVVPNDPTKLHGCYGPYIQQMRARKQASYQGSTGLGTLPIRATSSPNRYAISLKGLVSTWDFYQHSGNANYGVINDPTSGITRVGNIWPVDLMGTMGFGTVSQDVAPNDITWTTAGLQILGSNGNHPKMLSSGNFPVTGNGARTVLYVVNVGDISGSPVLWSLHGQGASANGTNMNMDVASGGGLYSCVNGSCMFSATGLSGVANNTWMVLGVTYDGGTFGTGYSLWLNGRFVCGSRGTACPTTTNPTQVLNTAAAQLEFPNYDFGTAWNGVSGGLLVWSRGLSTDEMFYHCTALKAPYAKRGITLTCN